MRESTFCVHLLAALIVAGCASADPAATANANNAVPRVVCTTERSTGSFVKKRVCRTPEEIKAQREAARAWRDRQTPSQERVM